VALALLLQGTAIEARATQDPAVVDADQKLLDEHLPERVAVPLVLQEGARVDAGEHVGDGVAARAQRLGLGAPLAVLHAPASLAAGEGSGWEHAAVVAEPANATEWAARRLLHGLHGGAIARRLRIGRGCRVARAPCGREHHDRQCKDAGTARQRLALTRRRWRGYGGCRYDAHASIPRGLASARWYPIRPSDLPAASSSHWGWRRSR
jgi:hypothetical protein